MSGGIQPTGGAGSGHGSTADAILRRWVAATLRRPRLFPARTAGISPLPPELHLSRGHILTRVQCSTIPSTTTLTASSILCRTFPSCHQSISLLTGLSIGGCPFPTISIRRRILLDRPGFSARGRVLHRVKCAPKRPQKSLLQLHLLLDPASLPRTLAQHHTPALPSFVFPTNSQNGRGGRR